MSQLNVKKGARTLGTPRATPVGNVGSNFFTALGQDADTALFTLRGGAFADPNTCREPTPRVQKLIENGEWEKRTKVPLIPVLDPSLFCCGEVGDSGTTFCTDPIEACSISKHQTKKLNVIRGWHISTGKKSALLAPRLPLESEGGPITSRIIPKLVGPDAFKLNAAQWAFVIQAWLDEADTARAWDAALDESPTEQSELESEHGKALTKDSDIKSTPKPHPFSSPELSQGNLYTSFFEARTPNFSGQKTSAPPHDPFQGLSPMEHKPVTALHVTTVFDDVNESGASISDVSPAVAKAADALERLPTLDEFTAKETELGDSAVPDSDAKQIPYLVASVKALQEYMEARQASDLRLKTEISILKKANTSLRDQYSQVKDIASNLVTSLLEQQEKAKATQRALEERLATLEGSTVQGDVAALSSRVSTLAHTHEQAMQAQSDCEHRLSRLERVGPPHMSTGENAFDTRLTDVESTLERVRSQVLDPTGFLAKLKHQVDQLRETLDSDGAIEIAGLTFASASDFCAWYHDKGCLLAICGDARAILQAMKPTYVSQEVSNQNKVVLKKTSIDTPLENAIRNSFDSKLPGALVGGEAKSSQVGTYDALISHLTSHAVWHPPTRSTGLDRRIETETTNVKKRIEQIRASQDLDKEVELFSQKLVDDSVEFCHKWVKYVNEEYQLYVNGSNFSPAEIWDMMMELSAKVWDEVVAPRMALSDPGCLDEAFYVWGMLKSWQVQRRFVDDDFRDAPALAGIFLRRVVMHGGEKSVLQKMEEITTLTKRVDNLQNDTKSQVKRIEKEIKEIETELKKKADK